MGAHGRPRGCFLLSIDQALLLLDVLGSFDFYVDHAEAFCILQFCNFASVVLSLDPLDPR